MIKLKNFSLEWAQVFNLNHWEIKMKKAFLVMFLILSFSGNVFAELKIGFVKVDQILKDAPQAAESNKKLESEFKTRTEKLKKQISDLNNQEKDYQKNNLTMDDKQKEKTQKNLQQNRIDIQRSERELREDIDLRRREEISKLQNKVTKVIEELAQKEKFDLILYTGVAYASDKVDVTPLILKELGKQK
jgi:outer membrane protein